MTDIEAINLIEENFGERVRVRYRTIGLGAGPEEAQEEGELVGYFNGTQTDLGRTLRYEFPAEDGKRYYLFVDEVLMIEVLPPKRKPKVKAKAPKEILIATRTGKVPLPLKRAVSLCGVPGFAVHRPLDSRGRYWNVSHIDSGLSVATYCHTIKIAIEIAERSLRGTYARISPNIPLAEWTSSVVGRKAPNAAQNA